MSPSKRLDGADEGDGPFGRAAHRLNSAMIIAGLWHALLRARDALHDPDPFNVGREMACAFAVVEVLAWAGLFADVESREAKLEGRAKLRGAWPFVEALYQARNAALHSGRVPIKTVRAMATTSEGSPTKYEIRWQRDLPPDRSRGPEALDAYATHLADRSVMDTLWTAIDLFERHVDGVLDKAWEDFGWTPPPKK